MRVQRHFPGSVWGTREEVYKQENKKPCPIRPSVTAAAEADDVPCRAGVDAIFWLLPYSPLFARVFFSFSSSFPSPSPSPRRRPAGRAHPPTVAGRTKKRPEHSYTQTRAGAYVFTCKRAARPCARPLLEPLPCRSTTVTVGPSLSPPPRDRLVRTRFARSVYPALTAIPRAGRRPTDRRL